MNSTKDQILVVDDDSTICEFLSEILKKEGYWPIVFTHPHDALAAFEEQAVRLAFIDINLSEIDIILRESKRLESLLDRIKNYLKPVEVRRQECSVNTVVKKSMDFLSPEIKQYQNSLLKRNISDTFFLVYPFPTPSS